MVGVADVCAQLAEPPVELQRYEVEAHRHVPLGFAIIQPADGNRPIRVTKVMSDGIAERCGLKKGDEIVIIGRRDTLGMSHDEITEAFTLGPGETVKLEIRRKGKILPLVLDTRKVD